MGYIYKIVNPKGKVYVGMTKHLRQRMYAHAFFANKGAKNYLANSIRKYGWDGHTCCVLEQVDDSLLAEREIFWIKELNTFAYLNPDGLNLTPGGEGAQTKWRNEKRSAEAKRNMAQRNYGRKWSDEERLVMSERMKIRQKNNPTSFTKEAKEKSIQMRSRPMVAYDINGVFIGEYPSQKECALAVGVRQDSVSESAMSGKSFNGQYVFRFKTENYPLKIEVKKAGVYCIKKPVICFLNSFQIEYPSCADAANDVGMKRDAVLKCAQTKAGTRKGYRFLFKEDFENMQMAIAV